MGLFSSRSSSSSSSTNVVENHDNRMALQDAVNNAGGTFTSTTYAADAEVLNTLAGTLPDAAVAMTNAGADVIERAGGAVVNLTRDGITANTKSFDSVMDFGAQAVDKLIDASTGLADKAISSYQPPETSNADALKWGAVAVAAVVGFALMGKAK